MLQIYTTEKFNTTLNFQTMLNQTRYTAETTAHVVNKYLAWMEIDFVIRHVGVHCDWVNSVAFSKYKSLK